MDSLKINRTAITLELKSFEKDTYCFFRKLTASKYSKSKTAKTIDKKMNGEVLDLEKGSKTLDESIIVNCDNNVYNENTSLQFVEYANEYPIEEYEIGNPDTILDHNKNATYTVFQQGMVENPRTAPPNIIDNESLKKRFKEKSSNKNSEQRTSKMNSQNQSFASKKFRESNIKIERSYSEIHGDSKAKKLMAANINNDNIIKSEKQFKRFMSTKEPETREDYIRNNESFERKTSESPIKNTKSDQKSLDIIPDNGSIFMDSKILSKLQFEDMNMSKSTYAQISAAGIAYICFNKPLNELYVSTNSKLLILDVSDKKSVTLKANVKLKNAGVRL